MSRSLLIASVALASYAALNFAISLVVATVWRRLAANHAGVSPAARARQLVWLRAWPFAGAAAITLTVIAPAFAIFEPERASEMAGPVVIILAAAALVQIGASLVMAVATLARTRAAARAWLRSAMPLDVDPPAGVPAYAIESPAPIVALVGVFTPQLVAARTVIESCTTEELTAIVAHERGHLHARDNLKRWLMACAPDALRWTPWHQEIVAAWHDAAEDAADDAATRGDERARLDLAALLVKIARLTPEPSWPAATVSPFVEKAGLDRRVRRLVASADRLPGSSRWLPLSATAVAVATLAVALNPATLQQIYYVVESVIAFGR
jgi:beta-lactamase regulating signal transducer with metallopeptidase domain